jgi:hypothetical protein
VGESDATDVEQSSEKFSFIAVNENLNAVNEQYTATKRNFNRMCRCEGEGGAVCLRNNELQILISTVNVKLLDCSSGRNETSGGGKT